MWEWLADAHPDGRRIQRTWDRRSSADFVVALSGNNAAPAARGVSRPNSIKRQSLSTPRRLPHCKPCRRVDALDPRPCDSNIGIWVPVHTVLCLDVRPEVRTRQYSRLSVSRRPLRRQLEPGRRWEQFELVFQISDLAGVSQSLLRMASGMRNPPDS